MRTLPLVLALFATLLMVGSASAQSPKSMKPMHKNIPCQACHAENAPTNPTKTNCQSCHGTAEDMAKKTESKYKKYYNPHNSLHYATFADCVLCHREHSESRLDCNNSRCHSEFTYNVP